MFVIRLDRSTFDNLTEDLALSILENDKRTAEYLKDHKISKIVFKHFPEFAAHLNFIIPALFKQKKVFET